jgi:hypothetical protein
MDVQAKTDDEDTEQDHPKEMIELCRAIHLMSVLPYLIGENG